MLEEGDSTYFDVGALPDPRLRDAIGGICIHWALLELTVERVLSNLEDESDLLHYERQLSGNLTRLGSVVDSSEKLTPDQKEDIRNLIEEVQDVGIERHRVVHGLWSRDQDGKIHSVFPAISRKVPIAKEMTVEDVRQVKLRIFHLGKKLRRYVNPSDKVRINWEKM